MDNPQKIDSVQFKKFFEVKQKYNLELATELLKINFGMQTNMWNVLQRVSFMISLIQSVSLSAR